MIFGLPVESAQINLAPTMPLQAQRKSRCSPRSHFADADTVTLALLQDSEGFARQHLLNYSPSDVRG